MRIDRFESPSFVSQRLGSAGLPFDRTANVRALLFSAFAALAAACSAAPEGARPSTDPASAVESTGPAIREAALHCPRGYHLEFGESNEGRGTCVPDDAAEVASSAHASIQPMSAYSCDCAPRWGLPAGGYAGCPVKLVASSGACNVYCVSECTAPDDLGASQ